MMASMPSIAIQTLSSVAESRSKLALEVDESNEAADDRESKGLTPESRALRDAPWSMAVMSLRNSIAVVCVRGACCVGGTARWLFFVGCVGEIVMPSSLLR